MASFTPTSGGAKTGQLTISHNGDNPDVTVDLTGVGVVPGTAVLEVDSSLVDFGSQVVGGPYSEAVTLTNTGDTSLDVTAITITGADAGEFDFDLTPPFAVAPGAPVTLMASFTPTSGGAKTGLLTISHNGDNPDVTIDLTGVGVSGGALQRINVAGPEVLTGGATWSADAYFTGSSDAGTRDIAIDGTTDDVLYQSGRHGENFGYSIPVDPGNYTVNLHFAEIWYGAPGGPAGGAGLRVFSVDVEDGQGSLPDYDIFADVGTATAVVKVFENILVTDGFLDIDLASSVEHATLSAIEVIATPE
jgi:hypothetical protein